MPVFLNRVVFLEYLQPRVFSSSTDTNILEDYLWHVLSSAEMIALLRVETLFDILLSRPLRWLSGSSTTLDSWSIFSMSRCYDLVETALERIATDGNALFDPALDIFAPIADEQPLFAAWRKALMEQTHASPDGTKHRLWECALTEARSPANASNAQATSTAVELAQSMANAALLKMRDTRLAIADKLSSLDGANSWKNRGERHAATIGAHTTNDCVESNFACADLVLRMFRGVSVESMSGIAQQARAAKEEEVT